MRIILVFSFILYCLCGFAQQRGAMTVSTGNVSHSGGAGTTEQLSAISITGSGQINGLRVKSSAASGTHGSIRIIIDGVTYMAYASFSTGWYYLPDNSFGGLSSSGPTSFRPIEFKTSVAIDLRAFTCTSCTTTADLNYSLD